MSHQLGNKLQDSLVDISTVCAVLRRSPASIYRDIKKGEFPKPLKLGGSSRWRQSDLEKRITGASVT